MALMSGQDYWTRMRRRKLSRRMMLRASVRAGIGAAGLALVGCGDDDDDQQQAVVQAQPQQQQQAQSQAQQQQQAEQQAMQDEQQQQAVAEQEAQPQAQEQAQQQAQQQVQAVSTVPRGGIVKFGAPNELIGQSGMDPATAITQSGLWRAIYDPLIATRADGQIDLDASLAESFELVDDVTLSFAIREGVKFHDDTDLNSESIKLNLERAVDTSIPGGGVYAAAFAVIASQDVPDDRTLIFNLSGPNAALLSNLQERGGMILSPTHIETTPFEELRLKPVGTGPYQLHRWENEQSTILVPFQDSWQRRADGGPYALLDEFHYVVIPDPVVQAASLEAGDIDSLGAPDSQVSLLLDNDELTPVVRKGSLHWSWWINHDLYPADNVDFRRALMHAWDKDGMNQVFFDGRADLGSAILSNGNWAHSPQENYPTEFNMDKAEELLVRSGVPEEDRSVVIGPSYAGAEGTFAALAANWEQLGVTVVNEGSYADLLSRVWKNRGQVGDSHMYSPGGDRGEPDTFLQLALTEKGAWNLGAAPVTEVEDLVQDAVSTYDTEERRRIYDEIQAIHAERLYSILPGLYSPRYNFSRNDVGGAQFDLNGFDWFKEYYRIT